MTLLSPWRVAVPLAQFLVWTVAAGYAQPAQSATSGPSVPGTEEIDQLCAPLATPDLPGNPVRVLGSQDTVPRTVYDNRDLLVLDGGTARGLQQGQEFFVRRPVEGYRMDRGASGRLRLVHTAGWVRVVATREATAVATVVHACDGLREGDYLDPFEQPAPVQADQAGGDVQFSDMARVLFGDHGTTIAGNRGFLIIDRGADHSLARGTRLAIYRDLGRPRLPLSSIGEAMVIAVTPTTATLQIVSARDAVQAGDYAALRRPATP